MFQLHLSLSFGTLVLCTGRRIPHRHARGNLFVGASSSSSEDESRRLVASLIVQKEQELVGILEPAPGRLPPKAAVVASLRKEIAELRAQLQNEVAARLPPALASDLPVKPTKYQIRTVDSSTQNKSRMGASKPPPSSARGALLMVEQQLSVSQSSNRKTRITSGVSALQAVEQNLSSKSSFLGSSTDDFQAELEVLQMENSQLKARLDALETAIYHLTDLKLKLGNRKDYEDKQANPTTPKSDKARVTRVASKSTTRTKKKSLIENDDQDLEDNGHQKKSPTRKRTKKGGKTSSAVKAKPAPMTLQ